MITLYIVAFILYRSDHSVGQRGQINHKPDSVEDNHLSRIHVAMNLKRYIRSNERATRLSACSSHLAADGVYLPSRSPGSAVGSYPTRFTLIPAECGNGFVSVALSLQSPAVAVSNHPALRCPDFPHPAVSGTRLSHDLTIIF
jgi:hypothetical protein